MQCSTGFTVWVIIQDHSVAFMSSKSFHLYELSPLSKRRERKRERKREQVCCTHVHHMETRRESRESFSISLPYSFEVGSLPIPGSCVFFARLMSASHSDLLTASQVFETGLAFYVGAGIQTPVSKHSYPQQSPQPSLLVLQDELP